MYNYIYVFTYNLCCLISQIENSCKTLCILRMVKIFMKLHTARTFLLNIFFLNLLFKLFYLSLRQCNPQGHFTKPENVLAAGKCTNANINLTAPPSPLFKLTREPRECACVS